MGFSSLAGAGISGISSLLGASDTSEAADKAAQAQAIAGQNATNALNGGLQSSTSTLAPYTSFGSTAVGDLGNALTGLTTQAATPDQEYVDPSQYDTSGTANNVSGTANNISAAPYATTTNLSEAQLEQTPGYQFTLQQGLESTQNSAAARGLGVSGAALKGAATYATGLADNTYQNQFTDELNANNQNFTQADTAANTNFTQQDTAANTNYTQQLGANAQNYSNALTGAAQNFGQDQTVYSDDQAANAQSANILTGAASLGDTAAGQQVGANTSTAVGTANALTGVGSAQAAADNATGQANAAATEGVGNALTGAIGSYNAGQLLTGGSTLGNALAGATGTGSNSNFLGTVGNALLKNGSGSSSNGSMNV